ncbi:clathrin heavy chain 1-like [Glandiceps talaboti]
MAQQAAPVRVVSHLKIQDVGVSADNIGLNTLTMDSDKFICVREKVGQKAQVSVINVYDPQNVLRRSISADSAIMNPTSTIIALRAGKILQIFNLETNTKIKACSMDDVAYWTWISDSTIAIVTNQSVYHWTIEGTSQPIKLFDRDASLNNHVVIKYETDRAHNWTVMTGITRQNNRIVGRMQLYSVTHKMSYPMEGHASVFAEFHMSGNHEPSLLLCHAVRDAEGCKLHIRELGSPPKGNKPYQPREVDILFPSEEHSDIPVAMEASSRYDIIIILTINGYIHVHDLETGVSIYTCRISTDKIIASALYQPTSGIIFVNRSGQVVSVSVHEEDFIPYIKNVLRNPFLARHISSRNNLSGAEDLFYTRFNELFNHGNYGEAAKVAACAPKMMLRTAQTIQRFKDKSDEPGQKSAIVQYFDALLDHGQLNQLEAIELCSTVIQEGRPQLIEKWVRDDKLECSEELSEMIKPIDMNLSMIVYERAIVNAQAEPQRVNSQVYHQQANQQTHQQVLPRANQQTHLQYNKQTYGQANQQTHSRVHPQANQYAMVSPKKTRALYDFQGTSSRDLVFKQGEIISDIEEVDANWYRGTLRGRTGIFPKNFVEEVRDRAPPPLPSSPPSAQPSPHRSSQPTGFGGSMHRNDSTGSNTASSRQSSVHSNTGTPFEQLMNEYKMRTNSKKSSGDGGTD